MVYNSSLALHRGYSMEREKDAKKVTWMTQIEAKAGRSAETLKKNSKEDLMMEIQLLVLLSHPDKYEFLVSYKTQNESALHTQNGTPKDKHAHPLFMISPISFSHTYNLPSYSTFEKDNLRHAPKIPQKRVILKSGETMPTGNLEETSC
ncbi:hypothetical protein H5410_027533 [Solanum commersonii]|uniref:Uncharacterized protein n=1 Tax=Solanum commersonii TaxID=4109 RepID=A0A9J5YZG1_SOLCO|nr:hypothetical protein H5410_027533 [Solanum commersonii]